LRREKSLSKAIERTNDRLIHLEGKPGAGKSVALRYVTRVLALRAAKSKALKSSIPIYINLKELNRDEGQSIDRNLIESYVLKTLMRANDRNVEEFLDQEFRLGIEEGRWLFLFDSFDEIPEVLSSTEFDEIIKHYTNALSDFFSGFNQCRGVIASRHFRAPGRSQWAQFRILPLSEERRIELIKKANLDYQIEQEFIGQLRMAGPELRDLAKNPMLLGLLCVHVKAGNKFPDSAHTVLSTYLENRLNRDRERLQKRFRIQPEDIRTLAEKAAFCMVADYGLGLSPSRETLKNSLNSLGFGIDDERMYDTLLDGMEYIKLARSEGATTAGESQTFTFAHRRFQEYFATCIVLREPNRVSEKELLSDARWRETAAVTFQTQPLEKLTSLLEAASQSLSLMIDNIPTALKINCEEATEDSEITTNRTDEEGIIEKGQSHAWIRFPWPQGAIHLLSLLQDGFGRRLSELQDKIRYDAGTILLSANQNGGPYDKTWAMEVAGVAPPNVLLFMIRGAFSSNRQMLKDIAYRQASRLSEIPSDVVHSIYNTLLNLSIIGSLRRDYHSTRAHLARLDGGIRFLSTLRLLKWEPNIDFCLHLIVFALCLTTMFHSGASNITRLIAVSVLLYISYYSLRPSSEFLYQLGMPVDFSAFRFIVLIAYLRLITAALLIAFIVPVKRYHLSISKFTFPLIVCLLSWSLFSLIAARVGQFTHPIWWSVMTTVPPLIILMNTKVVIRWVRDNWRRIIAGLSTGVVFILILYFTSKAILANRYLRWTITLIFLCILVVYLLEFFFYCKYRIRLYVKTRRFYKIDADEFLDLICKFPSGDAWYKIMKELRKQEALIPETETEGIVEALAYAIDGETKSRRDIRDDPSIIELYIDILDEFVGFFRGGLNLTDHFKTDVTRPYSFEVTNISEWYKELRREIPGFATWEADIIDELCQIHQQIGTKKK
jgi:NACHT domain-containing protein